MLGKQRPPTGPQHAGKHNQHGGNIQVLTDPTGDPVWVSQVEPGSTHDITRARRHAFGALYTAAADGLPTLTDKGYLGARIGIQVPTKGRNLHVDHQTRNSLISALRAPAERANALLKGTWKALEHITLTPGESAPSPKQHSPYSTFNDQPGEKISLW